jgi:hypothetical protein
MQRSVAPKTRGWIHPRLVKFAKAEKKALRIQRAEADRRHDEYVEHVKALYPPLEEATMTITEKGRTFEELVVSEIFKPEDVHCPIISSKYDHEWGAFMVNRQSGIVDCFTTSFLLVKGTSDLDRIELSKIDVINHGLVELAYNFSRILHRYTIAKLQHNFLAQALQADDDYAKLMKERERKRKKSAKKGGFLGNEYFIDPSMWRKNFRPKVDDLKKKVVDGTQCVYPITRVLYDSEFCELVLYRDDAEKPGTMIRLFSAFELTLLDPSYISFTIE